MCSRRPHRKKAKGTMKKKKYGTWNETFSEKQQQKKKLAGFPTVSILKKNNTVIGQNKKGKAKVGGNDSKIDAAWGGKIEAATAGQGVGAVHPRKKCRSAKEKQSKVPVQKIATTCPLKGKTSPREKWGSLLRISAGW